MADDDRLTREDFLAWERRLGFDQYGGLQQEAAALGVSDKAIQRLRNGEAEYSRTIGLAMAALEARLKPFKSRLSWDTLATIYPREEQASSWQPIPVGPMPLNHAVATVLASYVALYPHTTIQHADGVLDMEEIRKLGKKLFAGDPP